MLPATSSDVDYTMALTMSTIKQSSLTPLP